MNFKNAYIAFIPSPFVEEYLFSADFSPPGDYDSIILEVLIGCVFFLPLQSEIGADELQEPSHEFHKALQLQLQGLHNIQRADLPRVILCEIR